MSRLKFEIVPDVLWERDPPARKGRKLSTSSQQLLDGRVLFIEGERKTLGHLYKLARNHGLRARTKTIEKNGVVGTLIKFEDP